METPDDERDVREFFEEIPERFIVIAEELDREVYEQFLAYVQEIDPPYDYTTLLKRSELLCESTIPISQKQTLLTQLAQCETVEAYRLIERYSAHPDPALEQWSKIALYECRMRLEQELLDEPIGLISTGLGGEGHRLRYLVVLGFRHMCPQEGQQQRMKEMLQYICQRHDSALEQVEFHPSYLLVQVLVSLDVAVGEVIEESMFSLNQQNPQIYQDYLVTNVEEPTDEEIQEFLNELRAEE